MEFVRDNWTKNDYDDFIEVLRSYADEKYRSFHSSLIPDNDKGFFNFIFLLVSLIINKY